MSTRSESRSWAGRHRGLVTLTASLVAITIMTFWGLAELTTPFPASSSGGCSKADRVVTKTITRPEVTISIYNAGARPGTAAHFGAALTKLGFQIATVGNAPSGITVPVMEVVGTSVSDPATKLVAAALGSSATVTDDPSLQLGAGVNVFIGPHHRGVVKHPPSEMALASPTVTCLSG
ncbi:MAG: hypothetical protein NVSMB48_17080 [Marmoricola sp.]